MRYKSRKKKQTYKKKFGGKISDIKLCSELILNCDRKTTDGKVDEDDGDCNYYFDIDGNMCRNSKYYKVLLGKKGLQCRKSARDGEKKCDTNTLISEYLDKFIQSLNKTIFGDIELFNYKSSKLNLEDFITKFMEYPKRIRSENGIIIYKTIEDIDINFEDCFLSQELFDLITQDNEKELFNIFNILRDLFELDVMYRKTWLQDKNNLLLLLQYNLFKNLNTSAQYKSLFEVYIKTIYLVVSWFAIKKLINLYNQLKDVTTKTELAQIQREILKIKRNPNELFAHVYNDLRHKVIKKFLLTIKNQIIPLFYDTLTKLNESEQQARQSYQNRQSSQNRQSYQNRQSNQGSTRNYYDIFGITQRDNDSEIKKAYRQLALYWHPDKCLNKLKEDPLDNNKMKNCEEHFKLLRTIFEVLNDPVKRREYNSSLVKSPSRSVNKTRKAPAQPTSSTYTRRSSSYTRHSPSRASPSRDPPSRDSPSKASSSRDSTSTQPIKIDPSWIKGKTGEHFKDIINELSKSKGLSSKLKMALSNRRPGMISSKIEISDYLKLLEASQSEIPDPDNPGHPFRKDTDTTGYIEYYFKSPVHPFYSKNPDHSDRDYY